MIREDIRCGVQVGLSGFSNAVVHFLSLRAVVVKHDGILTHAYSAHVRGGDFDWQHREVRFDDFSFISAYGLIPGQDVALKIQKIAIRDVQLTSSDMGKTPGGELMVFTCMDAVEHQTAHS